MKLFKNRMKSNKNFYIKTRDFFSLFDIFYKKFSSIESENNYSAKTRFLTL